jgi:lipopolysaccharide export system protein LptC
MSAAYGTEPRDTRAFRATHRSNGAGRFRAAKRHSRRVRLLRVGLPVVAVIACVLLALVSWFNPLRMLAARLPISVGDVIVSGTKIKMENPKLSGFTRDKRRYDIVAGAAAQDLTQPGMIELQDITAVFEMQDKTTTKLVARDGMLDTKNDRLTLEHDIVVITSKGEEGYFEQAVVDTKNGNVVSEKPVRMKLTNGTVKGNRFELKNSGEIVRFEKGVVAHMKFENPNPNPKPAQTSAATP